jgi:hypothetical protein
LFKEEHKKFKNKRREMKSFIGFSTHHSFSVTIYIYIDPRLSPFYSAAAKKKTRKNRIRKMKVNRVKSSALKGAVFFFCLAIAAAQDDSDYDVSYRCHI